MSRLGLFSTVALLALTSQAHAIVATIGTMNPSELLTFSSLPPSDVNSSSIAPIVYLGGVTVDGYTFSPVGKDGAMVVKGGVNLDGAGPGGNRAFTADPYKDPTNYLAVQGGGAFTENISFAPKASFTLYWGSIDPSNKITFYNGTTVLGAFTGAQLAADYPGMILDNGGQSGVRSNLLLTFSGFPEDVTSVQLKSSTSSFEFALLSSVPEPSTWAMLLIGFAGLGMAGYRARAGGRRTEPL
jgi:hypothetical protein